ncbi:LPS-assembly protein LptD [Aliiroseovarius sp. YM-037]|uniref:LPS-assembly protein LptD n=1 Tax=Aliiroseovarius sp. YM-037 TaxID=3341728 RepID=UPI003A7FED03
MLRAFVVFLLLTCAAATAQAQNGASLIADSVRIDGTSQLVAEGNVEVFYESARLQARRITFDRATGQLQIEGPLTVTEGDGVLLLADSAELSTDLRNGIMRGARMVLDQQLQLAAAEINRVGGRYTELYKTVASSCQVCPNNPVPLWQIRSRRIIHDQEERQLYFENAQLRVMDVPIFYLPRLRLPDPTLQRATGFLIPTIRSNSRLGFGLKVPYFIRLGDHRDLTLTPYFSGSTRTLELRYRQAYRTGDITFEGAISDDDIRPNETRGYLFADGKFDLPRDFELTFDLEVVSDDAYLLEYGYSDKDRLDSEVMIGRARRDELIRTELVYFKSLRDTENNDTIPSVLGGALYHRRFEPAFFGGQADLRLEGESLYRRSTTPGNDGRDMASLSAQLDWRRDWTLGNGMVAAVLGQLDADYFAVAQGGPGEEEGFFHSATIGTELRWPMARSGANGVSHLLEPVVQVLWTDENLRNVPNEDSTLLEFDEGNLYSLSRFPGGDVLERGLRANVGLTWTRYDPKGWSMGLTVGRIFRADDLGQFTAGSGLPGTSSDWLAALQLKLPGNISILNRALFDDRLEFTRNETRLDWRSERVALASSYIWMDAAPAENRPETSEWSLDGAFRINENWTGKADWRFDFIADRAARAGIGLEYENECVKVDLSLSRRFTSSTSVSPTTDFGLTISLTGFGTNGSNRRYSRRCTG